MTLQEINPSECCWLPFFLSRWYVLNVSDGNWSVSFGVEDFEIYGDFVLWMFFCGVKEHVLATVPIYGFRKK